MIAQFLEKLVTLVEKGRHQQAIEQALAAVEAHGRVPALLEFLGYAYYQTKQYQHAIDYLQLALQQQPEDFYKIYMLANSLQELGSKSEAIRYFIEACKLDSDHCCPTLLSRTVDLAIECQDSTAINELASWLKRRATHNPAALVQWQKLLLLQGRFEELQKDLDASPVSRKVRLQLRYIRSVKQSIAEHGGSFRTLGKAENIPIVSPTTEEGQPNDNVVMHIFAHIPYVAELPQAVIIGDSSLILIRENIVVSDMLAHPQYGSYVDMRYDCQVIAHHPKALLIKGEEATASIAEGIMLSGLFSAEYGHWSYEFLPKLQYLERHPQFTELPIIIDEGMPSTHYEFLRMLVKNPLHLLKKGQRLRVERLLVAPTATFCPPELVLDHKVPQEQMATTVSSLRYLREKIVDPFKEETSKSTTRIFLSRRHCGGRHLINEEDILEALRPFHFDVVFVERLSFQQQVRVFQQAECIIAPNGSALNNAIFARKSVKLLIISQQDYFNWIGWLGPMMALGYSPKFVCGESVGQHKGKHSDYVVPPEKIVAELNNFYI